MFDALPLIGFWFLAVAQIDGVATRDGARVELQDRQELPNSRHTADVMDATLIAPVGAQVGGGGIDFFDSVRLSIHGRSATQLRFFWGVNEISDPARPGQPLVDMPVGAWDRLVLHTLWSDKPGVTYFTSTAASANSPKHPSAVVQGSIVQGDLGNGRPWWPNGGFDRNDARDYGAPKQRRALTRGKEGELRLVVPLKKGTLFILGERIEHNHRYLTTSSPEALTRDTALMAFSMPIGAWALDARALLQLRYRSQEGGQDRFDDAQVAAQSSQGWLLQAQSAGPVGANAHLVLGLGVGGRVDDAQGSGATAVSAELSDTWLLLRRPQGTEQLRRWQATASATLSFLPDDHALWHDAERKALGMDPGLHVVASASVAQWHRAPHADGERSGSRYLDQGISMNVREGPQNGAVLRHALRAGLESHWPLGAPGRGLDVSGGVDLSGVSDGSAARPLLAQAAGPSAGAMLTWRSARGLDSFVMLRREPEAITAQVGDFLGAIGPRGGVYAWQDTNQDGLPDADETGLRLGGFGSSSHAVDGALRRPGHTQLALGFNTPKFLGLRVGLRGVGHALNQRYTVTSQNAQAKATGFHDPGGDGRGEVRAPSGGQDLTVYQEPRVPERYVLSNADKLSYYLGLEAEIRTEPHPMWFVSILGATYLARTGAPFGNFADRNDPGMIDESSAGANNNINSYGRQDSDRAFALKILAAVRPVTGLSLGLAARYRDGQPFTRIVVDSNVPQGPVALMATPRGKARHTALMLWDLRLRYETAAMRPLGLTIHCDVYNLLGSATEIVEDPRTGPTFRRALESIPGRAMWLGVALAFLP